MGISLKSVQILERKRRNCGVREGQCDSARKRESDRRKVERRDGESENGGERREELRKPGPDPLRGCN